MWSKKYPIRIRTNTRKPLSQDSNKMAAAKEPELTPNEGTAEPSTTSHQENASTGQGISMLCNSPLIENIKRRIRNERPLYTNLSQMQLKMW